MGQITECKTHWDAEPEISLNYQELVFDVTVWN
jgi:hypothetical protein